jgi:hypothetical protein
VLLARSISPVQRVEQVKRFQNANIQPLIDEVIVYVGQPRRVFEVAIFRWPLALESKNLQKVSIRKSLVPLRRVSRKPRRNVFAVPAGFSDLRKNLSSDPIGKLFGLGFPASEDKSVEIRLIDDFDFLDASVGKDVGSSYTLLRQRSHRIPRSTDVTVV